MSDKRFKIDFFELSFLAEACIPPCTIARHSFWIDLIDSYYEEMTVEERNKLYSWLSRSSKYKSGMEEGNKDVAIFDARFNPFNQYVILFKNGKEEGSKFAFLFDGKYHTKHNVWIAPEYIQKVEKL